MNKVLHNRFFCCPCCLSDDLRCLWVNNKLKNINTAAEFMYGGFPFIDSLIQCNNCGYHYIRNPFDGEGFYNQFDVSEYNSLKSLRKKYFKDIMHFKIVKDLKMSLDSYILDIGAGEGDWLEQWREFPNRYATEKNIYNASKMKSNGIHIIDNLDKCHLERFDLVCAFDFLEHVLDPDEWIGKIYSILKPGGSIIIGVPNMDKIFSKLLKQRYYLYCPMHYSYFTRRSAKYLIERYFREVTIVNSPRMNTSINGVLKWTFPRFRMPYFDLINLPLGYKASLIILGKKM